MGYIYLITNTVNSKKYVGQTQQEDIKARWSKHRTAKNGCPLLKNAIDKYGINSFKFQIICICFDEDCNKYEYNYINKYNTLSPNGYNLMTGGGNSKHNPETLIKISESKKGAKAYNYGKHISEEQKQKTKETWRKKKEMGYVHGSDESRKRFLEIKHLGTLSSIKEVAKYTLEGNFICKYSCSTDAAEKNNINLCNLRKACSNNQKYRGFVWKYLPKDDAL